MKAIIKAAALNVEIVSLEKKKIEAKACGDIDEVCYINECIQDAMARMEKIIDSKSFAKDCIKHDMERIEIELSKNGFDSAVCDYVGEIKAEAQAW